jgi:hypothetical protein
VLDVLDHVGAVTGGRAGMQLSRIQIKRDRARRTRIADDVTRGDLRAFHLASLHVHVEAEAEGVARGGVVVAVEHVVPRAANQNVVGVASLDRVVAVAAIEDETVSDEERLARNACRRTGALAALGSDRVVTTTAANRDRVEVESQEGVDIDVPVAVAVQVDEGDVDVAVGVEIVREDPAVLRRPVRRGNSVRRS